jgi:hypothetical protein
MTKAFTCPQLYIDHVKPEIRFVVTSAELAMNHEYKANAFK